MRHLSAEFGICRDTYYRRKRRRRCSRSPDVRSSVGGRVPNAAGCQLASGGDDSTAGYASSTGRAASPQLSPAGLNGAVREPPSESTGWGEVHSHVAATHSTLLAHQSIRCRALPLRRCEADRDLKAGDVTTQDCDRCRRHARLCSELGGDLGSLEATLQAAIVGMHAAGRAPQQEGTLSASPRRTRSTPEPPALAHSGQTAGAVAPAAHDPGTPSQQPRRQRAARADLSSTPAAADAPVVFCEVLPTPQPLPAAQAAVSIQPACGRRRAQQPRSNSAVIADAAAQQCAQQMAACQGLNTWLLPAPALPRYNVPRVAPDLPHIASTQLDTDEVDISGSDAGASSDQVDGTAAALRASVALRKQARIALAVGAGCSRAVPQHAVALVARLQGADVAAPRAAAAAVKEDPASAALRSIAAACWRWQAKQRGSARAVSR